LVIWVLELGIYLEFGLPARSSFGEGRCLRFGAYQDFVLFEGSGFNFFWAPKK